MTPAAPQSLLENSGLAFVGEPSWTPAGLTAAQAHTLGGGRNPTGRPNGDVLRCYTGVKSGRAHEHWQVDFPRHYPEQEAALYLEPYRHLRSRLRDSSGPWWLSPNAQPELRTVLARLERFLATPRAVIEPVWGWIDSNLLPDDSLLVVARDDDFTQGLLNSRFFRIWWHRYSPCISAPAVVISFPFPWPPATLLSSLTRVQEEQRLALARAARRGETTQLTAAVATLYGWPADLTDDEVLARLTALNRQRTPAGL